VTRVKAVEQADLVVEAIIENLKIKRNLFGLLDSKARYVVSRSVKRGYTDDSARPECIFTSNTSSLSIADIAESCQSARRERYDR
jgi:3-hydroxyacyl-CoA dehydrogenase